MKIGTLEEAGRAYYLRNNEMKSADIALHLTVRSHVVTHGPMNDVAEGTFWESEGNRPTRLVAVRINEFQIVLMKPFLGSLGQTMLGIADMATPD